MQHRLATGFRLEDDATIDRPTFLAYAGGTILTWYACDRPGAPGRSLPAFRRAHWILPAWLGSVSR